MINKFINDTAKTKKSTKEDYMFFSRELQEPFESLEALKEAEEAHFAKLKAKEDKAATKKADALKVEDAFKALNSARKVYKETITEAVKSYQEKLVQLKSSFEADKTEALSQLSAAEEAYSKALKNFTDKYPEGFHLTLKDGDFETTIHSSRTTRSVSDRNFFPTDLFDMFLKF